MQQTYLNSKTTRIDTKFYPLIGYYEDVIKCRCKSQCNLVYEINTKLTPACSLGCAIKRERS